LINEYKPGEGIMPHEDGAAYAPVVATVSLGGTLVLDLWTKTESSDSPEEAKESEIEPSKEDGEEAPEPSQRSLPNSQTYYRILQEPRSLLITTDKAYASLLHGISPITHDENLGPETVVNWDLLGDKEKIEKAGGVNERSVRVSLTYRDVLKVSKVGLGILGRR
jgi:alkylated DNA repair protein alkB homolog 6